MKQGVVLLGHGSRREEANQEMRELALQVKEDLSNLCRVAFLSFGEPDLEEAVHQLVQEGVEKIIVVPLFLVPGNHIRKDVPGKMQVLKKEYPRVGFSLARHLGIHPALTKIIKERIKEAGELA